MFPNPHNQTSLAHDAEVITEKLKQKSLDRDLILKCVTHLINHTTFTSLIWGGELAIVAETFASPSELVTHIRDSMCKTLEEKGLDRESALAVPLPIPLRDIDLIDTEYGQEVQFIFQQEYDGEKTVFIFHIEDGEIHMDKSSIRTSKSPRILS